MKNNYTKYLFATLIGLVALFFYSCKAEDNEPLPPAGPIQLWDNVIVPAQNGLVLDTTASDFLNGVFTYNFNGTGTMPVSVGDVIVGEEGDGFIRRIVAISQNNGIYTFNTEQATLEDVFKSGEFNFNMDMAEMDSVKSDGFNFAWNGVICDQEGLRLEMLSSNVNFNPNWNFDFGFNSSGISNFEMSTYGSAFSADAELKANITQTIALSKSDTIGVTTKKAVFYIPVGPITIPIVVRLGFYLIADYSAGINGTASGILNYNTSAQCDLGMKYANQSWQSIYNVNVDNTLSINSVEGNVTGQLKYAWRPNIVVWIAGVRGPYINVLSPNLELKYRTATSSSDWDASVEAFLKTGIGANVSVLGKSLGNYGPVNSETERLIKSTPSKIERTSGDAQTGLPGQQLTQPLKVRVLGSDGTPQKKVPVYFTIKSGGGSVTPTTILSDENGYAQTYWTAGPNTGLQEVEAKAKKGDGSLLSNAPIDFGASIGQGVTSCTLFGIQGMNGTQITWSTGETNTYVITVTEPGEYYYWLGDPLGNTIIDTTFIVTQDNNGFLVCP